MRESKKRANNLYRQRHPDRVKEWDKRFKEKHPERYNQIRKESNKRYRRHIRQKLIALLGGKCVYCGFSDLRALEVDHVNNNGHQHRAKVKDTLTLQLQMIREIKAGSKDYQLLCANHNRIKAVSA